MDPIENNGAVTEETKGVEPVVASPLTATGAPAHLQRTYPAHFFLW